MTEAGRVAGLGRGGIRHRWCEGHSRNPRLFVCRQEFDWLIFRLSGPSTLCCDRDFILFRVSVRLQGFRIQLMLSVFAAYL